MTTHPVGGQLTCSSGVQITDEKTHVAANEHDIFTHLFITQEYYMRIYHGNASITIHILRIHGCCVTIWKKNIPRSRHRTFYDY